MALAVRRYLGVLSWVLCALGAVMALILAVVALIYWIYRSEEPALAAQLPGLMSATLSFAALAVAYGVSALALWRRRLWLAWPAQLAGLLTVVQIVLYVAALR